MFSVFLELVKKVGIFIIIGQTIMHFGISKKYEKYMKLVISIMVAAQIIFAFDVYLKRKDDSWQMISAQEYLKEWDADMKKLEETIEESKEEIEQNLKEEMEWSERNIVDNGIQQGDRIKIEKVVIK